MKRIYNMKKTVSIKMFIAEFGENFSEHMKERLMELELRSVLTRKEDIYSFTLKHVEHIKYPYAANSEETAVTISKKEYVYGQFKVIDGILYFSEKCTEGPELMESPIVHTIFDSLDANGMVLDMDYNAKKVDDGNIDYVVDSLLTVFPEVTQKYKDILKHMDFISRK